MSTKKVKKPSSTPAQIEIATIPGPIPTLNTLVDVEALIPSLNVLSNRERDVIKACLLSLYNRGNEWEKTVDIRNSCVVDGKLTDEFRSILSKNLLSYNTETFKIGRYPNDEFERMILGYFSIKITHFATTPKSKTSSIMKNIDIASLSSEDFAALKQQIAERENTEKNYQPCLEEVTKVCAKYSFTLVQFIDLWDTKTNIKVKTPKKEKGTRKRLTDDQKKEIVEKLKAGAKKKDLEKEYGVSYQTILLTAKKAGLSEKQA